MITSRTAESRPFFKHERWAKLFIDVLEHYRGEYELHAFVAMPDHFHALITPAGALERALQLIKGGFSYRAKKELQYQFEVWQKGFADHRIRDLVDYEKHIAYIHMNSVRKKLCQRPEEYPYSSAHSGFMLDPVPQRLKPLVLGTAVGAAGSRALSNRDNKANSQSSPAATAGLKAPPVQDRSAAARATFLTEKLRRGDE